MKQIILLCLAAMWRISAIAQNSVSIVVQDESTGEPLEFATVVLQGTNFGGATDANGRVELRDIPNGTYTLQVRLITYHDASQKVVFPGADPEIVVQMEPEEEEEPVIITSTRTSRTIETVPTRVEVIGGEEIEEKSNMRPSNVSMLLHESTGIQVQQTSATSANSSIRIQGLDGRYTQLLKDGYANFGNFASGLSILEIPPMDLKQVEVIKGPASPLYGGGAIAGVVNFISKTPGEARELRLMVNQSHIGQSNAGVYASQRFGKWGYAALGQFNYQRPYDVDKDDFSELPLSVDFTAHPRIFFYPSERTTFMVGNSLAMGDRQGGDMRVIREGTDSLHQYSEANKTLRNTSTLEWTTQFNERHRVVAKSSLSLFDRRIEVPGYIFEGRNLNSFTDISWGGVFGNHSLVAGVNTVYDRFDEVAGQSAGDRDFTTATGGVYLQHTWDAAQWVSLESGVRLDGVNYRNALLDGTEAFVLPRVSALFKWSPKLSSRIGGGMGYKAPTIFTEATESVQYQGVAALQDVRSERSMGGTADLNYATLIGENWLFTFNHMFFLTSIQDALVLEADTAGSLQFVNANAPLLSRGFETNAKVIFKEHYKLFVGYTYTDARALYLPGDPVLTLLPRNKLNLVLLYEKHGDFKIGLEGYYSDQQSLGNGEQSSAYWEFGFMAEKTWGKFSVYVNAENFTDTRQSRYKRVVSGDHTNPSFDPIWTHTEGRVFSAGVKVRL